MAKALLQTCSVKKVLLEISQNSQENTCAQVFSCKFGKFPRSLAEHLWWLLLNGLVSSVLRLFTVTFYCILNKVFTCRYRTAI